MLFFQKGGSLWLMQLNLKIHYSIPLIWDGFIFEPPDSPKTIKKNQNYWQEPSKLLHSNFDLQMDQI